MTDSVSFREHTRFRGTEEHHGPGRRQYCVVEPAVLRLHDRDRWDVRAADCLYVAGRCVVCC